MAKLHDKFFNRVIEGELSDLSAKDAEEIGKVAGKYQFIDLSTLDDVVSSSSTETTIEWDEGDIGLETLHQLLKTGRINDSPIVLRSCMLTGVPVIFSDNSSTGRIVISLNQPTYSAQELSGLLNVVFTYLKSTDTLKASFNEI